MTYNYLSTEQRYSSNSNSNSNNPFNNNNNNNQQNNNKSQRNRGKTIDQPPSSLNTVYMGATSSLWNSQDHHSQSTSRGRDHHQQQQQQQHLQPSYHGECESANSFSSKETPRGQTELWTSLSYFTHTQIKRTASQFEGHFKLFCTLRAVFLLALMTQQTINIWPFILCL